ncbi:MAG: GH3 auxin-responsive promoter family protein [Flavobacteriales bacterium]
MGLKKRVALSFARRVKKNLLKKASLAQETQFKVLQNLINSGSKTLYGKDHGLTEEMGYEAFKAVIPARDYEAFRPYIEKVKANEADILWPGKPDYLCKTSGTTSGAKYIPLTKESLKTQIAAARNALLCYIAETGKVEFIDGKMIFLQGSPVLETLPSGMKFGRLSGIVANYVPSYLQRNRMPSYETNCIEDWEEKVNAVANETLREDMSLISGIPSWVQMYYEELLRKTGKKTISEVFPNFSLFVYGGVNFEPYKERFKELIGKDIPTIELYPASEGFIAFQDSQQEKGMLLNIDAGMFFEFIPADEASNESPTRLHLGEVELNKNYALLISSNAGLWAYSIGDTIEFTALNPPRIRVTGRIKHFTSAFGEHVIGKEVEMAMAEACQKHGASIREFHVAPQVNPIEGLPYHEWLIEFESIPKDKQAFIESIEYSMRAQNVYYLDLINGKVLRELVISELQPNSFESYMKSQGKLGGQNKVPRLSNDRKTADALKQYLVKHKE